jgi:hypothetical protein
MEPGGRRRLDALEGDQFPIKPLRNTDFSRSIQAMASDINRIATAGVVGGGKKVIVATLKEIDCVATLTSQGAGEGKSSRPSTDNGDLQGGILL